MLDAPSHDLDRATVQKAYGGWAPIYDALCGPVFLLGRKAAVKAARRVGGRVLEIGVGTGLSFPDYDETTEVTGIDITEPMLEKARRKIGTGRYPYVRDVLIMDAHNLEFEDASFNVVVAQFVITLVANPERVLDEAARVLRPGGEIVLMSHLYSEQGIGAAIERWVAQRTRAIGLRPEFPFSRLVRWADTRPDIELAERRDLGPLYSLVRFRKLG
jgi:phosphatidylethanolamine/phosphatidyl-N-methylethanolamine N-methyltransferase